MSAHHDPVLVRETLAFLSPRAGLYLDATLGDGGHAEALLSAEPGVRLLASDRDPASLAFARERLRRFGARVTFAHGTFRDLPAAHAALGERLAGGDHAQQRHLSIDARVKLHRRRLRDGDAARYLALPLQHALRFERLKIVGHNRRRGDTELILDLANRRRVALILDKILDVAENIALSIR